MDDVSQLSSATRHFCFVFTDAWFVLLGCCMIKALVISPQTSSHTANFDNPRLVSADFFAARVASHFVSKYTPWAFSNAMCCSTYKESKGTA